MLIAPAPRDDEPPAFEERRYSEKYSCPYDGFTIDELEPRSFSFNSPARRLPDVHRPRDEARDRPGPADPEPGQEPRRGRARRRRAAVDRRVVADEDHRGRLQGPRLGLQRARSASCPKEALDYLLYAKKDQERVLVRYRHERGESTYKANFEGIITNLERRYRETDSDYIKAEIEKFMVTKPCPTCGGKRLRPEILAVTIGDQNIWDVATMSITDALRWAERARRRTLNERERAIAYQVVKEIVARLGFLVDVGLDYLTLDRTSVTLSGGEAQRIRLATQIGTTLMGVLYILDEPSIGLHQRDNAKLIATLTRLRDLGNTVLVVEHDEETIRTADWVVDIGPGRRRARRRDHRERAARGRCWPSRARSPARSCAASARSRSRSERRKGSGKALRRQGRARAQPARRSTCGCRSATFVAVTGVSRQRQEHARHRGPVPRPGPRAQRLARAGRRPRQADRRRAHRQDHRDRPEPDRADAALEPGDLHRACSGRSASCSPACRRRGVRGYSPGPLLVQRQGWPLRELQGRRHPQDRDAVPARRLRARARSARASATTARRSRSTTRASRSPTCSR